MLRFLQIIFLLNCFIPTIAQNQWTTVGTPGFCFALNTPFVSISPNGVPYIVFRNGHGTTSVMKFDSSRWVYVGDTAFSAGDAICGTIAFDKTGIPYVAYSDGANNGKTTVMKFDGNNWVIVGTVGFTPGGATYTSIAIDGNGTPYVAFRDQGASVYNSWPNNFRASLMKFDGTNWVYVGTPGFSAFGTGVEGALYTSLAIDKNDIPYVAYTDVSNDFKASVMKFDGNNWVYVGAAGFSSGQVSTTSLTIDSNGTPFIAYWDRANDGKATVMKFDGSNWIPVGLPGLTSGVAEYTSLAIDKNNTLYLAYRDYANSKKASVMKFDGTNWVTVGISGFSTAQVYNTTLAIDGNGNLYVGYKDCGTPACDSATVMKFGNNVTGINETENNCSFKINPNPSGDIFNIQYENYKALGSLQLTVTSIQGKGIYKESINDFNGKLNKQINLHNIAKGTYFVELNSDKAQEIKKIIVE